MAAPLPANHTPAALPTRIAPRLVELCFQTAGIWELGTTGRLGLPQHIDRLDLTCPVEAGNGRVFAMVSPHPETHSVDAQVIDATGHLLLALRGYRTVALPNAVDSALLAPLHGAMQ